MREKFGTPTYVYDLGRLKEQADKVLAFPNAFGLTVRYAMKASPNAAILKVFRKAGLHIDASSGYEVRRAVKAGKGRGALLWGIGMRGEARVPHPFLRTASSIFSCARISTKHVQNNFSRA